MINTTIAHYKVTAKLGQGGMGEVYRATDTKLDREVAIKVLPESFAQDKERLARFEREAKVLASLDHPNIGAILGVEESDGKRCLILQLIEGETLTERLRTGAMPIDEALDCCKQIAEALEAAHEKGIIHRDLKPANIKITPDGKVKVLDFGLAKAAIVDSSVAPSDNSQSPTLTADYTRPGVILGTAAYMSPEQARAKPVDKRSDVWSFGCVLYECLTGNRPFQGEDITQILARVVEREADWTQLPGNVPVGVRLVLQKCLSKDRKDRLHDISDARVFLDQAFADPNWEVESGHPSSADSPGGISKGVLSVAFVLTALFAITFGWFIKPAPPISQPPPQIHVPLMLDRDLQLFTNWGSSFALSKDGQHLAFITGSPRPEDQSTSLLHLRSWASDVSKIIQGSEGARRPFFSPDGQKLGFLTRDALKTVPLSGRNPREIVRFSSTLLGRGGGAWGKDGSIVYSSLRGLMKVPESGGEQIQLTTLDVQESMHRWPQFLPDGRHVLFTDAPRLRGNDYPCSIKIVDIRNPGSPKTIIPKGSFARYVESGHIIYLEEDGWLHAVRFDTKQLEVVEPSTRLVPVQSTNWNNPQFAVAETAGILAYLPGAGKGFSDDPTITLVWVSEGDDSNPVPIKDTGDFRNCALAADDQKVAVVEDGEIWIIGLQGRRPPRRLTVDEGDDSNPLWVGEWIVFSSSRSGKPGLWKRLADGSGEPEPILEHEQNRLIATSVSDDGKFLVYTRTKGGNDWDIWIKNMDDETDQGKPLLNWQFTAGWPAISPDGRSIAYFMDQGKGDEIYLRKINGSGFGEPVSTDGGVRPQWSADGDKLFYGNNGSIWSVDVTVKEGEYEIGKPKEVVELPKGASVVRLTDCML